MSRAIAKNRQFRNRMAGVTITEMITVMAIIGILMSGVVGAYARFQNSTRLSTSAEKIISTLHHARSLAISNNAIYQIRISNFLVDSSFTIKDDPSKQQAISIYCFPKTADAVRATTEPLMNQLIANTLAPNNPPELVQLAANAWNPTTIPAFVEPDSIPRNAAGQAIGPGMAYNNYMIERVQLDHGVYLGIQNDVASSPPPNAVLSFLPDGTASTKLLLFVTDDESLRDNRTETPAERELECSLRDTTFYEYDSAASRVGLKSQPRLKFIRVTQAGMIKLVREVSQ